MLSKDELVAAYKTVSDKEWAIGGMEDATVFARAIEAAVLEKLKQQEPQAPAAWTNLLAYVLQDDMHNRLTPRVIDIAYTAFMLAKRPNTEDGGASDWFNDTKPKVAEMIKKLHKDLTEELPAAPVQQEPVMWQSRFFDSHPDTVTTGTWSEWEEVKPRNPYTDTVQNRVDEFRAYIQQGYKYELRALYAGAAPVQQVGINGLTEAETDASASVMGLTDT